MLLYYLFWILTGLFLHFYIIFGTNLLTGGPAQIVVFCLFQCFGEKEYQTESKRNETFRNVIFLNKRDPGDLEWPSRNKGGRHEAGGAPTPWVRPPPSWAPCCSTDLLLPPIYISIYPSNIQEHHENLIPPRQPSLLERSHLGAFSGAPPEGALIMEGLYINSMACPVMCE